MTAVMVQWLWIERVALLKKSCQMHEHLQIHVTNLHGLYLYMLISQENRYNVSVLTLTNRIKTKKVFLSDPPPPPTPFPFATFAKNNT